MIRLLGPLCVIVLLLGCAETESTAPVMVERTSPIEMETQTRLVPETPGARIAGEPISPGDSGALKEVAKDSVKEVQLGDMAAERSGSAEIKRFGGRIASDHRQLNQEIFSLGERKGVSIPQRLELSDRRSLDEFADMQSSEFDESWIKGVIEHHRDVIDKLQRQAREAQDADIRSLASRALPTEQEHLRRAEELQRSIEQEP